MISQITLAILGGSGYNIFIGGEDLALTKEDLQAIAELTRAVVKEENAPIVARLDGMDKRLDKLEQGQDDLNSTLQTVKNSQIRVELEQFPRIAAALDGHKLNSEKLDDIKKNLEDITPTVQALDILHQTGYAK